MQQLRSLFFRPNILGSSKEAELSHKYWYWKIRIFYAMYVGYGAYYLTRKSFTYAMPFLMQDLGFTKADLGILGSILYLTYGLSKFVSGVVSDKSNPRYFMSIGLMCTGLLNIFFGLSSSILFFGIFWGLNGWFQGWGFPPCARLLTHWYPQKERGTWWSLWSTSQNIGTFLSPYIIYALSGYFGSWRYAMYVPGVFSIGIGLFLMNRLRDTPQSLGLPEIDKQENLSKPEAENFSKRDLIVNFVLKNRAIWLLGFAYFFVYFVRASLSDWGQLFLLEEKNVPLLVGASCILSFEIGGLIGSLVAGSISDWFFAKRRGIVTVLYSIGIILAISFIWWTPVFNSYIALSIFFILGFFIFGPQMLIGVMAAEMSHKKASGSATGFVGWLSYLGATVAGYPLGKIVDIYGWSAAFAILTVCSLVTLCLLLPLWSAQPRSSLQPSTGD